MYFTGIPSGMMTVIKNNNIHTLGGTTTTSTFPIYLGTAFSTAIYDIDYNNMHAPSYVGYAGGNRADITAWRSVVTTDKNSVKQLPTYVSLPNNLKLTSGVGLSCVGTSIVPNDIENLPRAGSATMGCYEMQLPVFSLNTSLANISGLRTGNIGGQTDALQVEISNTGLTPITAVDLEWTVNGQPGGTFSYAGTLNPWQTTTVNLGTIIYPFADAEVKI
jgi:hypothetical protein